MRYSLLFLLLLILLLPVSAAADGVVIMTYRAETQLERALIMVECPEDPAFLAEAAAARIESGSLDQSSLSWLVAAAYPGIVDKAGSCSARVVSFDERKQIAWGEVKPLASVWFDSVERALAHMRQEREKYQREQEHIQRTLQQLEQRYSRLYADAQVIAGADRLVQARERFEDLQESKKRLLRDKERLRAFIAAVKSSEAPSNFARRERALAQQLGELSRAAKEAVASEDLRAAETQRRLQRELRIVEEARQYDKEALEAELTKLRLERERLEGS